MSLPGKLTIGFLEEDNPVKAYFRIHLEHTMDADGPHALDGMYEKYPDDGYIRIVPDKNELAGFKSRMRALGRYCALDLRKFPGENEKIRPNKNYGPTGDRNQYIVYSDAICAVPCEIALEVLDAQYVFVGDEVTLRAEAPGTRLVLLRRDGMLSGPWMWSEARDVAGCVSLRHAPELAFHSLPEAACDAALIRVERPSGAPIDLMTAPALFGVLEMPALPPISLAPAAPAISAAQASAAAPRADEAPAPAAPAAPPPLDAPAATAPFEAGAATIAQNTASQAAPPAVAALQSAPAFRTVQQQPMEARAPVEDKPWIQKTDLGGKLRAIGGRLSLRDQALQAQSGINPRRGRSLSEVVDEQWRRSRYEQLGHPIPPEATGVPALSPIDRAADAVAHAWALPEARGGILAALLGDASLREALSESLKLNHETCGEAADARRDRIEAERLELINEIDALRMRRADAKKSLMEELRQSHQREFEKYEANSRAMREEFARNEEAAKGAQRAAEAAQELLKKTSEQVEQAMLGHLMTERAIDLVMHMNDRHAPASGHPVLYEPSAGELISDLRVQLESAGFTLDNDDAVSLLCAMMTSGMVIVSGPTGSGKTQLVRQLAAALGLTGPARRFAEAHGAQDESAQALFSVCDDLTPCILMLDDVNLNGEDALDGAIRLQEQARAQNLPLCLMLTVQDAPDGRALPPRLLSRAFFLRLDAASASSRWQPPRLMSAAPERAVALSAIRDILRPDGEIDADAEARLSRVRDRLDGIGYTIDRRTLNEMYWYCASIRRAGRMTGIEALDRALSQRALPAMLASMELEQLLKLPDILCDMPRCMRLMEQPLPLPAL